MEFMGSMVRHPNSHCQSVTPCSKCGMACSWMGEGAFQPKLAAASWMEENKAWQHIVTHKHVFSHEYLQGNILGVYGGGGGGVCTPSGFTHRELTIHSELLKG